MKKKPKIQLYGTTHISSEGRGFKSQLGHKFFYYYFSFFTALFLKNMKTV